MGMGVGVGVGVGVEIGLVEGLEEMDRFGWVDGGEEGKVGRSWG